MHQHSVDDQTLFTTLVNAGSFSRAADRLKLSPSAVSRQLQKIERELAISLLNRTTRSLSLTEQGQVFFESCLRIMEEREATLRRLHDLTAKPMGQLKIAATQTFAKACLIPALARFSEKYPDIRFELMISDEFVDLVEAGVDVAIRIGSLKDSRLKARALMRSSLICCASPDYIARVSKPENLIALTDHQLILTNHLAAVQRRYMDAFPELDLEAIETKLFVNNVLAGYEAALSGLGVTYLPEYLVDQDLKDNRLVDVFSGQFRLPHEVYLIFQNTQTLPSKTRVFIDFLLAQIAQNRDC